MGTQSGMWWLPALVSALLVSPCVAALALSGLGDGTVALWAGVVGAAALTALLGLRFGGPVWAIAALATLAAAVAFAAEVAFLSGVS